MLAALWKLQNELLQQEWRPNFFLRILLGYFPYSFNLLFIALTRCFEKKINLHNITSKFNCYEWNTISNKTFGNDKPQCKSQSKVATSVNPDRLISYVCNLLPHDFTTLSSLVPEKFLRWFSSSRVNCCPNLRNLTFLR